MKESSQSTKLVKSACAASCIVLSVSAAQAQVINFSTRGAAGFDAYSGQGAYSDPGNDYWNTMVFQGTFLPNTGFDSTEGFANAIANVSLTDTSAFNYNGTSTANVNGQPSGFFSGIFGENNGVARTETLGNIPAGTYDLYLYGGNSGQDRGTIFTLNGVQQSTVNPNALNSPESAATSFILGGNYVVYSGITVSDGGSITFTYQANTSISRNNNGGVFGDYNGVDNEGDFNGLQLVTVVPEPSTYALTGLGLVSLVGFRRWKRGQASA